MDCPSYNFSNLISFLLRFYISLLGLKVIHLFYLFRQKKMLNSLYFVLKGNSVDLKPDYPLFFYCSYCGNHECTMKPTESCENIYV